MEKLFEKKIWLIDDVASALGVTKGYIYNLTYKDKIPHHKKSRKGKLYFFPEEIIAWIKNGY
ncbi:MAG: hypothetical protein CME65_14260 [Halobacteriovoraceae bacterium]|nr:hypothetical protein [Halobacteriovoraceae bacterium]|tara:strand:- start:995 stop:1180 length:186 start_codon:yes stop_codon:yes gene_type:complete